MITFDAVSKRYKQACVLNKVSFNITPGEVFGYIGPNGAGKTTSIKILTGLIRDYEGTVLIDGKDAAKHRMDLHRLIGYLPQEADFQDWRTVDHALSTFAKLSGIATASEREDRIQEVLTLLGIAERRRSRIVHLSGGTVQKLRLAQAIIHEPRILILDEPLSGLDPASRYQVKDIIRRFASEERVIFFSSHILSDVENVATKIGILHEGEIRKVGTPKQLREEFGLGNVLELELSGGIEVVGSLFPSGVVQNVEWPAERHAERRGDGTVRLHLDPSKNLDTSIKEVLRTLIEMDIPLRSFRHLQPSLEEVYLRMTGGKQ